MLIKNIIFFISTFPAFVFRSNFYVKEVAIPLILLLTLTYLNSKFLNFLDKKNSKKLNLIYMSIILTYGIDNHLGLYNGIIQPNSILLLKYFTVIYWSAIFLIIGIILILYLILLNTSQDKINKIFLATLSVIFVFNLLDNAKNYQNIPAYEQKTKEKFERSKLVLILDEMSGMNSLSSQTTDGKEFNKIISNFFEKNNFVYYSNVFSNSENSVNSISSLINFEGKNISKRNMLTSKSKNYFNEYNMDKNELFSRFSSISVIQNIHINYCNNKNINKCYQYNPFDLKLIDGEIDLLSKYISIWNLNGSIFAKLTWRLLKQFGLIVSIVEPEGEKVFIKEILKMLSNDINSKKYDLNFAHILVPHRPYGFDVNCNYDVKLSNLNNFYSNEDHIKQHNLERKCVVRLLSKFLLDISDLDNLEIFILSDHGARITNKENSSLSSIFAHKEFNSLLSRNVVKRVILQEEFIKLIDE